MAIDVDALSRIARRLGYLPLAIDQAGTYIATHQLPLAEYLPKYEARFIDIMNRPSRGPTRYRANVCTTWEASFRVLEAENIAASRLALLLGFFSADVLTDLLSRGRDTPLGKWSYIWQIHGTNFQLRAGHDLESTVAPLLSYSLVKYSAGGERLRVHPVVHMWIREHLTLVERQRQTQSAVRYISKAVRSEKMDQTGYWIFLTRVRPDLDACVENLRRYIISDNISIDNLEGILGDTELIAQVHCDLGLFSRAEMLYEGVRAFRVRAVGQDHPDTLSTLFKLAHVHSMQGNYCKAEWMCGTVANARQEMLGRYHPDTLTTLCELADIYSKWGKSELAEDTYESALKIGRILYGRNSPSELFVYSRLADVYLKQGLCFEAERTHRLVLESRRKLLGTSTCILSYRCLSSPAYIPSREDTLKLERSAGRYTWPMQKPSGPNILTL
jgi:tetratricopeptide (TPR) repeat protein